MTTTETELKALAWPSLWRLMKRDVTERETRVAAYVVACSFALGRSETGPLNYREVAAACGMSQGNASMTLRKLARMGVIRETAEGCLQFLPESDHARGHHWVLLDRLDPSARIVANRVEQAHRRRAGEMALPGMEEPDLGAALGEVAVEAAAGRMASQMGRQSSQIGKNGFPNGEGGCGTGGGARFFSGQTIPESGTTSLPSPLKSFSPVTHDAPPLLITLKRESVPDSGTDCKCTASKESEARMDGEGYLDPASTDTEILIKRLKAELGEGGPDGMTKKGPIWRMRITGTINAANDPTSAEGIRFALNELKLQRTLGKNVRIVGGFLHDQWMNYCTMHGWKLVWNAQHKPQWEQCAKWSYHAWRQQQKRQRKQAHKPSLCAA